MMHGADALSMSLYDYTAALHCWSKAHSTEPAEVAQLSDDELAELEAEAAALNWEELEPVNADG